MRPCLARKVVLLIESDVIAHYADVRQWRCDDKFHSLADFPAIEWRDGWREWYKHGQIHRPGGRPAIIADDGVVKYYVANKQVPQAESAACEEDGDA